jgi:hypothetical protein
LVLGRKITADKNNQPPLTKIKATVESEKDTYNNQPVKHKKDTHPFLVGR